MSAQVQISEIDGGKRIAVSAPYHAEWRRRARFDLGGRWDSSRGAWQFDARNRSEVSEALRALFGTDGATATETVTVRIAARDHEVGARIEFAGRTIAERPARDHGVRLMPGVILLSGAFDGGGGTWRHPQINAAEDVYLKIADVPKVALDDEAESSYEVIDDQVPDLDALRAEKDRLLSRLAEIDIALAAAETQV